MSAQDIWRRLCLGGAVGALALPGARKLQADTPDPGRSSVRNSRRGNPATAASFHLHPWKRSALGASRPGTAQTKTHALFIDGRIRIEPGKLFDQPAPHLIGRIERQRHCVPILFGCIAPLLPWASTFLERAHVAKLCEGRQQRSPLSTMTMSFAQAKGTACDRYSGYSSAGPQIIGSSVYGCPATVPV
jgi:hypothetical protein